MVRFIGVQLIPRGLGRPERQDVRILPCEGLRRVRPAGPAAQGLRIQRDAPRCCAASLGNGLATYFLGSTWVTLKAWLPSQTMCGWIVLICLISTLVDRVLAGLAPFVTLGMVLWGYLTLLAGIIIDTGMSLGFDD